MTKRNILYLTITHMLCIAIGACLVKSSPPQAGAANSQVRPILTAPATLPTDIYELQEFLIAEDYRGADGCVLTLDGKLGPNTEYARDRWIGDQHGAEAYRKAGLLRID